LEPVLEATKRVFDAGKHVEVSTLMITDISDDDRTAERVSSWVLKELDARVPVHFVRFHPDYKLRNSERTPIPRLIRAREIALGAGVKHVYLGNVYDAEYTNTHCVRCNALLISRFGLNASPVGLNDTGNCLKCGQHADVRLLPRVAPRATVGAPARPPVQQSSFEWHGDIRSRHVQVLNAGSSPAAVYHRPRFADGRESAWFVTSLQPAESYRFIIAKSGPDDIGADLALDDGIQMAQHEVFDRAHFPTLAVEEVGANQDDRAPLPVFKGNQLSTSAPVSPR
jgi:pyruvate formate lyase activating enzyme